jgi:1,4-alpha-glucan branching enzyme
LLQYEPHSSLNDYVRKLNLLYAGEPSLYELDAENAGFEWIDFSDADTSIVSFVRRARDRDDCLVVVCNFTPVPREQYRIGVPRAGFYREVLNSDSEMYGGSNMGNLGGVHSEQAAWHGRDDSISVTVPPLSCLVFKPE